MYYYSMLLSTVFVSPVFISPQLRPITTNQPHLVPISDFCRKSLRASGKELPPTFSVAILKPFALSL